VAVDVDYLLVTFRGNGKNSNTTLEPGKRSLGFLKIIEN